jgi:hypothetical protein
LLRGQPILREKASANFNLTRQCGLSRHLCWYP